jgi:hypothetical protein
MSSFDKHTDSLVDSVLEIILFPLYFLAIFIPFAAIGSFLHKEYRAGVSYTLAAIVAYSLARGIGKYFDSKK